MKESTPDSRAEKAYLQGISHLEVLRDCLAIEREKLMNLDVDALWDIAEEKQRILTSAEESAEELRSFRPEELAGMGALSRRLNRLKEEIRTRAADNMAVIQDNLEFYEELLSILVLGEGSASPYGKTAAPRRKGLPLRISREV